MPRLLLLAGLAAFLIADAGAAGPTRLAPWRSYQGVTWDSGKDAAASAHSASAPIAGIHFDAAGRAFVSTPRLLAAASPATLSTLDTRSDGGPARLAAFPSREANAVGADPATHLRSVLGFHVDRRNGWLWALDQGFVAGEDEAPAGGQKILVLDLRTGAVVKRIGLDEVADRKGSFLNDIAVDEARRIAYVSDSGLRSAPANQAGLIVADFDSGSARRVLHQHPSVMPRPGAQVRAHGKAVWPGKPLMLGINGIALSPDAATLYWTVTTDTHAYAMPTAPLRAATASQSALAAPVRDLGEVGGNTDGIVTGASGALYITDVSRGGIVEYDPRKGAMRLLARDEAVLWPDTPTIGPDGDLVFSASNLHQHFAGQVQAGTERYVLWRLRTR